jgi:hypothetical protein
MVTDSPPFWGAGIVMTAIPAFIHWHLTFLVMALTKIVPVLTHHRFRLSARH